MRHIIVLTRAAFSNLKNEAGFSRAALMIDAR
jgi:hypothetical protein